MTLHDTPFAEIAALNDQARTSLRGCTLMLTKGIFDLPQAVQNEILQRVRSFDTFTPDNDPYGEHDFGAFDFGGERLYWKFDYYDVQTKYLSPDPTDSKVTNRVLTVMLAEEY